MSEDLDLRREILRNVVLCQSLGSLARKPPHNGILSGKAEHSLVAGVNSSWAFYDLVDRVLLHGRQPDSIFDLAYEAQSASIRNRLGGKVNYGQIYLLIPIITAQVLDFLESGTHEDIESILERTGDVLRNTTEEDVRHLERFVLLGYEIADRHRERTGQPKSTRPALPSGHSSVWEVAHDFQHLHSVRQMTDGYPDCHQIYRFLLHNVDTGLLPAITLIHSLLLPEIGRVDVVSDFISVGLYLVLTKHPESVLFT